MDIMELSRKMEANFLETHTTGKKSLARKNFTPRFTRSQINHNKDTFDVEAQFTDLSTEKNRKQIGRVEGIYENKKVGLESLESVYINKKPKVVHKNLETIYEHPVYKKGNTVLLGTSKVKRSIYLGREFRITSKTKSKLRKMKIKRLGKKRKTSKMTDDEFKSKMLTIENFLNDSNNEIGSNNGNYSVVPFERRNNDTYVFENCNIIETDGVYGCQTNKHVENQIL